jgi:hypothetical protein
VVSVDISGGILLGLAGLALVDSTSVGTLFIPIWLLLTPGPVGVRRIVAYLGTIAGFYFLVGLALAFGGATAVRFVGDHVDRRLLLGVQLAAGAALFAYSFKFGGKNRKGLGPGALRWRERATGTGGRIVALALVAALTELATMLPYLAAIGILTSARPHPLWLAGILAGYCVVMVVPALVLLGGRVGLSARLTPALLRLDHWIVTKGGTATGWILGGAGFLIARDAATRLWF